MKYYNTYDALAFAEDKSFVEWVLQRKRKSVQFWERWVEEHPEKAGVIEEAKQLVLAMQFKQTAPSLAQIEGIWERIDEATAEEAPKKSGRMLSRRLVTYAAAAAVAVFVTFYFLFINDRTITHDAKLAEHRSYVLPDSSEVELNAASQIRYQPADWSANRRVELTGEAFFRVREGERFTVSTAEGTVEVLGTSFNVFARNGQFSVHCFTGRVRVKLKSGAEKIMEGGDRVVMEDNTIKEHSPDQAEAPSWLRGRFYYEAAPLDFVFEEIERQFDVKIRAADSIRQLVYKGFFNNDQLDSALLSVTYPMGLSAEKSKAGQLITITPTK